MGFPGSARFGIERAKGLGEVLSLVESSNTAIRLNPFNMEAGATRTTGQKSDNGFEQQLTQILSESLGKLGLESSGMNISFTGRDGASAARQIVISWQGDSATSSKPSAAPRAVEAAADQITARGMDSPVSWCVWNGPCDSRDGIPVGGGQITASGAPLITPNEKPTANQYGYAGLAALNPYFTNPGNPLREGYVLGFHNWFRDTTVAGGLNGPMSLNRSYFATEEGAAEALRLVRQYEPGAELVQTDWSSGLFAASNKMYQVSVPGNGLLNAGMLLRGYYNNGFGVSVDSDAMLQQTLGRSA